MATIERRITQDGKESFRVKIRLRGSKSVSGTFERKVDAKRWAAETETAIRHGRYFERVEAQKHTVRELIERYCREILPQKKRNTRIGQEPQFMWWKQQLGDYTLSSVTPALLNECKSRIAQEGDAVRSPTTIKRYMAALSHAFTIAVQEWQWLEQNPFRRVTKPKESSGRVRWLSIEERKSLLEACERSTNPYLYTIVVLALATGARKAEVLNLRWKDVDLAAGLIKMEDTKNGESRGIPVRGKALDLLRRVHRRDDFDYVFPNNNGDKPVQIRTQWETAIREARISNFCFHDLRHSCASYLAMNGATPGEIAAVLGHKTLQMVKRYAHIGVQHTAEVLERMNTKVFDESDRSSTA